MWVGEEEPRLGEAEPGLGEEECCVLLCMFLNVCIWSFACMRVYVCVFMDVHTCVSVHVAMYQVSPQPRGCRVESPVFHPQSCCLFCWDQFSHCPWVSCLTMGATDSKG